MQPQSLFDAGVEVRQGFDVGVGGHRVLVGDGGGEFGFDTSEVGGVREEFEEGGAQSVGWIAVWFRFVIRTRRGHGERGRANGGQGKGHQLSLRRRDRLTGHREPYAYPSSLPLAESC